MSIAWYALRSKPNKEEFLAGQLESYDMEAYFPQLQVRPVNPRSRKSRPYFPGYLFVRVDLDVVSSSTLRWMPGASGLVSFDGEPASVPEQLIIALRKQIDHLNTSTSLYLKNLRPGDKVLIQNGPFSGYEGIFDARLSGENRVRVLLNFLQARHIPIDLHSDQIRRAK